MSADPTAAAALRVPRSYVDALYIPGEQLPASRAGTGVVVSVDSANTCTVLINDEEVPGVVWLGTVPPRLDDVVEVEMRGDLLCIPATNDIDTFTAGQETTVAHIVSDTAPVSAPAQDVQVGGSMRSTDAWSFLGADTANWVRELSTSGQGMRCYQTGQPTLAARNMATIPSGEAGIGPNDAGYSWTSADTQTGTYSGTALVESSAERTYTGVASVKATWLADPKPSCVTLRVGGHTIGQQYTAKVFVWVPSGSPNMNLIVQGVASAALTPALKNIWAPITVTYTATAVEHIIGISTPAGATAAGTAYLDAFSVVAGATALATYFDGSTPDSATEQYLWLGTAHLSASERWLGAIAPSVLLGTNLVTNPSFETNTTGWQATRTALVRTASGTARAGGWVARLTNDGVASTHYLGTAVGGRIPVTAGQVITFCAYARLISGTGLGYTARGYFYDAGGAAVGTSLGGAPVDLPTGGTWARLSLTVTVPAGAVAVGPAVQSKLEANTDVWELDAAFFQVSSAVADYFDGDTADAPGAAYQWTGTAHASTSTWRTSPIGAPPGTAGTLWSQTAFNVETGDVVKFDAHILELANSPTAQLVLLYSPLEDASPAPGDVDVLAVPQGAPVACVGADTLLSVSVTIPETVTFPTSGAAAPKSVRLGIKLVGTAAGTSQVVIASAAATHTPKAWPLGSQWMDPDAEVGGLVTIGETTSAGTSGTTASTITATPIPGAKRATVTAPETTGGVAVFTFSGAVQLKTAVSTMFIRLVGPAGVLVANTWISGPTDGGNYPFMIRGSLYVNPGEEVTVTPTYLYSGASVTVPHVLQRMVTAVEFYPGAVRSAASSDPMIRYWDGDSWRPSTLKGALVDLSADATAALPTKTNTTTACTRSTSSIHEGSTLTLTANVTIGTSGVVTFYRSTSSTGPWTSLGTATISLGKATRAWTAVAGAWFFRAVYSGSTTHNGSTSAATPVTNVLKRVTHTVVLPCAWVQAYEGDGSKLTGTGHDAAVRQGYYSSSDGNCKSLLRFSKTAIPAGADVTSVTLVCKAGGWEHWYNASGGTLAVGSLSNITTVPTTWPASDTWVDRSRHNVDEGGFSLNLSSWGNAALESSVFTGLTIGPGPSISQSYYGYSATPGQDQFTLKVTYDTWE